MPESIARRTNTTNVKSLSKNRSMRACLGSGVVCLSLLTGCAGSPEQPENNDIQTTISSGEQTVTNNSESTVNASNDAMTAIEPTKPTMADSQTQPDTTGSISETNTAVPDAQPATAPSVTETFATSNTPENVVSVQTIAAQKQTTAQLEMTEAANDTEQEVLVQIPTIASAQPGVAEAPKERTSKNLGKHYGIWTLKKAEGGMCKLSTPSLQTGNKEYSTQIWMDVEEQRVVVNSSMSLNISHPKSGLKVDSNTLHSLNKSTYTTRGIVNGDLTGELAKGNVLHVFINGEEVGNKVLMRDVKLSNIKTAISALKTCKS